MSVVLKINKDSYFTFSGGEVHTKVKVDGKDSEGYNSLSQAILMREYSMNGLMCLMQTVETLERNGYLVMDVTFPYFPYARQDRVIAKDESFSLKIFCELLNTLNLDVTIYDPHSDVTPALLKRVKIVPQWKIAAQTIPSDLFLDSNVLFISPDAGAYKKVSKLMTDDKRIVLGTKERNDKGEIIKTNIYSPVDINKKECIIVDDICDGGKTFIELAKVLKEKGASKVYLYVTHGIFSKGFLPLIDGGIDHIYTTNTFRESYSHMILQMHNEFITVKEIDYD